MCTCPGPGDFRGPWNGNGAAGVTGHGGAAARLGRRRRKRLAIHGAHGTGPDRVIIIECSNVCAIKLSGNRSPGRNTKIFTRQIRGLDVLDYAERLKKLKTPM